MKPADFVPATHAVLLKGQIIGHVVRRSRVAAGTPGSIRDRGTLSSGDRKPFWTACPGAPHRGPFWRPGKGASIGTRFKTREAAVEALAVHHQHFQGQAAAPRWRAERKERWGF